MPNWCSCKLIVRGDPDRITQFASKIKGEEFKLSQFYPVPMELEDIHSGHIEIEGRAVESWIYKHGKPKAVNVMFLKSEYGAANLLEWCCNNWGTKWDVGGIALLSKGELSVGFDSAWSPPNLWLIKVSRDYPDLRFELAYAEGGIEVWGAMNVINGDVDDRPGIGDFWASSDVAAESPLPTPECQEHLDKYDLSTGG
jgi:hypothetical protein